MSMAADMRKRHLQRAVVKRKRIHDSGQAAQSAAHLRAVDGSTDGSDLGIGVRAPTCRRHAPAALVTGTACMAKGSTPSAVHFCADDHS